MYRRKLMAKENYLDPVAENKKKKDSKGHWHKFHNDWNRSKRGRLGGQTAVESSIWKTTMLYDFYKYIYKIINNSWKVTDFKRGKRKTVMGTIYQLKIELFVVMHQQRIFLKRNLNKIL